MIAQFKDPGTFPARTKQARLGGKDAEPYGGVLNYTSCLPGHRIPSSPFVDTEAGIALKAVAWIGPGLGSHTIAPIISSAGNLQLEGRGVVGRKRTLHEKKVVFSAALARCKSQRKANNLAH